MSSLKPSSSEFGMLSAKLETAPAPLASHADVLKLVTRGGNAWRPSVSCDYTIFSFCLWRRDYITIKLHNKTLYGWQIRISSSSSDAVVFRWRRVGKERGASTFCAPCSALTTKEGGLGTGLADTFGRPFGLTLSFHFYRVMGKISCLHADWLDRRLYWCVIRCGRRISSYNNYVD